MHYVWVMSVSRDESYLNALKETHAELQRIRSSGNWLVIASIAAACFLYLGAGLAALAYFGADTLAAAEPIWFGAAIAVLAGPAVAIVMAGVLARQSQRSGQANALVLRASQLLLMPAEQAGKQISVLATQVKTEAEHIDETVETAHASLSNLQETLANERKALSEFVEQNRKSLGSMFDKLSEERQALAELSSAVEAQTEAISEAIPRQARTMAEAARMAQQEVAKADMAVDERLKSLDETGIRLGEKLASLGEMSIEAEDRSQRLAVTIDSMIKRMNESAQTVDTAIKASEMAASAATETSDALSATISNALDGTRDASEFIRKQSREAVAEALKAMAELKAAGEAAEAATKAASQTARNEADQTERRIQEISDSLYAAAVRATSTAEAGLDRARQRIERASALLNGMYEADPATPPAPMYTPPPEPPPQTALRPRFRDDAPIEDVTPAPTTPQNKTDSSKDSEQTAKTEAAPKRKEPNTDSRPVTKPTRHAPVETNETSTDPDEDGSVTLFDMAFERATQKEMGLTWKDLLSGLEAEPEERDEAARHILSEIEDAGVSLDNLFAVRETRKIAGASRKGDRQRQRAVREYAGSNVRTLQYRLEDDARFKASAERFIKTEAKDSIQSLSEAERSRSSAAKRLTAYLVLDAAFASMQAD